MPRWMSKVIFVFAFFPRLVLMITTPLDAREPYVAFVDASFNTSMDSMSFGLINASALSVWPPKSLPDKSTGFYGDAIDNK